MRVQAPPLSNNTISDLLIHLTDELDLSSEQFTLVKALHDDLAEWIKVDSELRYKADSAIYAHGSVRMGTIVKPRGDSDFFDIDLIYRRDVAQGSISRGELKKQVGDQLRDYISDREISGMPNGLPLPTLEDDNQCWTLVYGDNFRVDIVPSLPDTLSDALYSIHPENGILITDRSLGRWKASNPKAFAQWFSDCDDKKLITEGRIKLAAKANVEVEQLPSIMVSRVKTPLRRVVQLLKAHRNQTKNIYGDYTPSSMVISTLAAHAYSDEADVDTALINVLKNLTNYFDSHEGNTALWNPVFINELPRIVPENIISYWKEDEDFEIAFENWHASALSYFNRLVTTRGTGIHKTAAILSESFDPKRVEAAMKKYGSTAHQQRSERALNISSAGILGTGAGIPIKDHTFYGK